MEDISDETQATRLEMAIAYIKGNPGRSLTNAQKQEFRHLIFPSDQDVWALNPWAARRWATFVADAAKESHISGTMRTFTLFDNRWEIPLAEVTPEAFEKVVKGIRRKVGRMLRPHPFLLQIDIGFRRYTDEHYVVLSPHVHGLTWAPRKILAGLKECSGITDHGISRLKSEKCYDVQAWLTYAAKDTRLAHNVYGRKRAKVGSKPLKAKTRSERLQRKHVVVLLQLVGHLRKYDLTIASGATRAILNRAKKAAKKRVAPFVREKARPRPSTTSYHARMTKGL